MSLKSRIIPLSVLACAPIISMPLTLTSCGSNDLINNVRDLTRNYYPKFEKHESTILPIHKIHDLYLEKLLEEPEIFIDDYFWSRSWEGTTFEPFQFWRLLVPDVSRTSNAVEKMVVGPSKNWFQYDNELFSNLEITTQSAEMDGESWTFPTLSFTLTINSKVKDSVFIYEHGSQYVNGYLNGNVSCKLEFTNVPFILRVRSYAIEGQSFSNMVFSFEPFGEWLEKIVYHTPTTRPQPWKVNLSITSTVFGELTYSTGMVERVADDYDFNALSDEEKPSWTYGSLLSFSNTVCCLFSSSHYLEAISCKEDNYEKK